MEPLTINYAAIFLSSVLAMVVGGIWYGPLFGRKWMELIGVDPKDKHAVKKMQESAGPLYLIQFILTLFQVLVLAHLIADTSRVGGLERSLWIWAAFVVPTLAGAIMWTEADNRSKITRFMIQAGYQLTIFALFGLILQLWT